MQLISEPKLRKRAGRWISEKNSLVDLVGFVFFISILVLAARTEVIQGQEENYLVLENRYARLVIGRDGEK